jgi:alpha-galactosidase
MQQIMWGFLSVNKSVSKNKKLSGKKATATLTVLCVFALPYNAGAEILLVDLNPYATGDPSNNSAQTYKGGAGVGIFNDNGTWNGLLINAFHENYADDILAYYPGGSTCNLVYADGTDATGVSIELYGFTNGDYYFALNSNYLYRDYLTGMGRGRPLIIIRGLQPCTSYDVAGHSTANGSINYGANWTLIGNNVIGPVLVGGGQPPGKNVGRVVSDATGRIDIQLSRSEGPNVKDPFINGFEIKKTGSGGECAVYDDADMYKDGHVCLQDLSIFLPDWLLCNDCNNKNINDIFSDREMAKANQWTIEKFSGSSPNPPFSFTYNEIPFPIFLGTWSHTQTQTALDAQRTQYTNTYYNVSTGLQVRCVAVKYNDFPTIEWTVYFKNTSGVTTPIIKDVKAIDTVFNRRFQDHFLLHYTAGSFHRISDYQPFQAVLQPSSQMKLTPKGGRSTNGFLPYFNINMGTEGVIAVIGWSGQWEASFECDSGRGLRFKGGQELTNFKLLTGEEVRSPMAVVQFYDGDWIRAQNVWRRWMTAHNMPKPGGQPVAPIFAFGGLSPEVSATGEIAGIDLYAAENIPSTYYWLDAGWYPWINGTFVATGTWKPDPVRFPNGVSEVFDHAATKGFKSILWFEPERVCSGTEIDANYPRWLLDGCGVFSPGKLYDMGNPAARQWMINCITSLIASEGFDVYREDFNIDPLDCWTNSEASDRVGMRENNYVTGHLAYWDALLSFKPDLLIDSCASGGRRNDLEILRRAVPLLRSDRCIQAVPEQCHTYGISFWMPFHGTEFDLNDKYKARSAMAPSWCAQGPLTQGNNYDALRSWAGEWQQISGYMLCDYYPLTDYSTSENVWIAWQFDDPRTGEGVIQAFRRISCQTSSTVLKLRALDTNADYTIKNFDVPGTTTISGGALMNVGLTVSSSSRPAAIIITYKRQ